jgi:hypothetical protein
MAIDLPSVVIPYPDSKLDAMKIPEMRWSARHGVEEKFLYFASPEYNNPEIDYRVHEYSNLHVGEMCIHHSDQPAQAVSMVNDGYLWSDPAGIIIINSPRYMFSSKHDRGAESFIAHLICSLGRKVITGDRIARGTDVNFLETMQLDHTMRFNFKDRHLLVWGPISENCTAHEYSKTTQFLFAFRRFTRIILTTTQDMHQLLRSIKLDPKRVTFYFNFDEDPNYMDKMTETDGQIKPKKATATTRGAAKKNANAKPVSLGI